MKSARRVRPRESLLLPVLALLPVAGCGSGSVPAPDGVTVDTLPNGAPLVVNSGPGVWAASGEEPWRLVEDLRIGRLEGEGPDVFGSIRDIIPDAMGRIWVLDGQAHELRLFDSDGTYVRTVGGEGNGPGEFGFNPCATEGPNDEIWVEAGGRWQWFDTAGVLLGGHAVTRSIGCGIQGRRGDRYFAVTGGFESIGEMTSAFQILERTPAGDLVVVDSVPSWFPDAEVPRAVWNGPDGRPRTSRYVPFGHRPVRQTGPDGDFWYGDADAYRVTRTSLELDTSLVFERTTAAADIPTSVRDSAIAALRRDDTGMPDDFDRDQVPTTYRWIERIHVSDDGTAWIQRRDAAGEYTLDVFGPDGVFLGSVRTPPGFAGMSVQRLTHEHLYARHTDAWGVPYAVRFRIERSRAAVADR